MTAGCSDIEVCEFNPRGAIRSMRANALNDAEPADPTKTTETTTRIDSPSIFLKDAAVHAGQRAGNAEIQANCSLLLLVVTLLAFLFNPR